MNKEIEEDMAEKAQKAAQADIAAAKKAVELHKASVASDEPALAGPPKQKKKQASNSLMEKLDALEAEEDAAKAKAASKKKKKKAQMT